MADILIKNMEMPKNYPYRLTLHSDGHVEDHSGYSGHGHYQAIELPLHGRLIDAEKLQAVLLKWEEDARGRDNIELAYAYKTVREIIDDRDCVVEASK